MSKWIFTRPGQGWAYPTLGFTAVEGDIIEADLAPDAWWEPTDPYAVPTIPFNPGGGVTEPAQSDVLAYNRATNRGEFTPLTELDGFAGTIAFTRAALAARAGYDAMRSASACQAAAASAVRFTEAWADLAAWAVTSSSVQVSGGKLFGVTGGGGANHSFRVAPGATARIVSRVNLVGAGTAGQGVLFGFNRGTEGSAPSAGGAQSRGIYIRYGGGASDIHVRTIDNGAQDTAAIMSGLGTTTVTVVVTVDENYLSVGVSLSEGAAPRAVARFARDDATFPLNNMTVMINDSRGLAGSSIEPILEATIGGTSAALSTGNTLTPGQTSPGLHWGSHNGDNFLIATPVGYDSRKGAPAVIVIHGNGTDEKTWLSNTNAKAVFDAYLAAGFVVIAAANTGATSTWGATAGLDAYANAYRYARDHYNVSAVGLYANSMGGIEALNLLARDAIPGIAFCALTVPTYDLAENYTNPLYSATIATAYGGDYATNAVGHDPALMYPLEFRGTPVWALVATDDASVTPSANGLALCEDLAETNDVTLVEVTGGHSTSAIATNASAIATWSAQQIGHVVSYAA